MVQVGEVLGLDTVRMGPSLQNGSGFFDVSAAGAVRVFSSPGPGPRAAIFQMCDRDCCPYAVVCFVELS